MCHGRNSRSPSGIKSWLVLLICAVVGLGGLKPVEAAILDGWLDGFEEYLGERLAKKNETLKLGRFYSAGKPNAHGPIGTMGDHTHDEGEIMFTYRYMNMEMDGNRDGTNNVSAGTVVSPTGGGFIVTPTDMRMQMHMFSGMYGVNDTLTVMVMVPYLKNSMNHLTRAGVRFRTETEGVGDVKVTTLWRLYAFEAPSIGVHRFHANLGLSLPTGSITERDITPTGGARLPYPMQLGSGTVDAMPGITYGGEMGNAAWGFQALGTIRIGRNTEGYSKGDAYQLNLFGSYAWSNWISTSVRFSWHDWSNYNGRDKGIEAHTAPTFVPTADPNRRGGERLDFLPGINLLFPEVWGLENHIGVEGGIPIYQNLDGPQLETDWIFNVGWQVVY